jgi:hypothetical protein
MRGEGRGGKRTERGKVMKEEGKEIKTNKIEERHEGGGTRREEK